MNYCSISEAFGVDSLEKPQNDAPKTTTKVERVKFPRELVGDDNGDDTEDLPTMIPEERKITSLEVKRYISDMYTKHGMEKVWKLIDPRIKKKLLSACKSSMVNTRKWFDDIFSSPEKLLVILAILFVLILLLDSGKKTEMTPSYRPQEQFFYYPQAPQVSPELRW
jgi:hypothetical protein